VIVVRFKHAVLANPYGVRGRQHAKLPAYWWIEWDGGGAGYYADRHFRVLGTAFD
jgi:hypothetical protein